MRCADDAKRFVSQYRTVTVPAAFQIHGAAEAAFPIIETSQLMLVKRVVRHRLFQGTKDRDQVAEGGGFVLEHGSL